MYLGQGGSSKRPPSGRQSSREEVKQQTKEFLTIQRRKPRLLSEEEPEIQIADILSPDTSQTHLNKVKVPSPPKQTEVDNIPDIPITSSARPAKPVSSKDIMKSCRTRKDDDQRSQRIVPLPYRKGPEFEPAKFQQSLSAKFLKSKRVRSPSAAISPRSNNSDRSFYFLDIRHHDRKLKETKTSESSEPSSDMKSEIANQNEKKKINPSSETVNEEEKPAVVKTSSRYVVSQKGPKKDSKKDKSTSGIQEWSFLDTRSNAVSYKKSPSKRANDVKKQETSQYISAAAASKSYYEMERRRY